MKNLIIGVGFVLFLAPAGFASEQSMLVRVTGYWRNEGSGGCAAWTGARLRVGHCAVDPKKIPYGSTVVFPDTECVAVDTGPAVVSRKSARYCGRTSAQKSALVVDRFFETKRDAVAWTNAHSQFITVKVITPDTTAGRGIALAK
jgi:3D (Asp-Asp-Asp) domain-containing protein